MHPSHRIDVLKMEPVFHVNDREKNKVFYISPRKWQGHKYSNEMYEVGWNDHYKLENKKVEDFLQTNPNLQKMSKYIYIYIYIYIYLGGVVIIAYIAWDHLDECSWHILVDSIVLETIIGLLELLTIMIDLNK
jgi:hypothetical protein